MCYVLRTLAAFAEAMTPVRRRSLLPEGVLAPMYDAGVGTGIRSCPREGASSSGTPFQPWYGLVSKRVVTAGVGTGCGWIRPTDVTSTRRCSTLEELASLTGIEGAFMWTAVGERLSTARRGGGFGAHPVRRLLG